MFNNKSLYNIQNNFFNVFIILSWSLIIISIFGFSQDAPKLLVNIDYYIRIYICLFLMWRFHPFKTKYEFTELDRKIAFSAGLFILTTTALNQYLLYAKNKFQQYL